MTSKEFDLFNHPLDGVQLIEASAGTGKTWTLCALYLRLLLEKKLDVERILVVTFTQAATAELRERIRARLAELAHAFAHDQASDDPLARHWLESSSAQARVEARLRLERALHHFDQAAIYTVHGFCQRALLDTPFASAHPLAFDIQEDDQTLRLECAIKFWQAHVEPAAAADANFAAWLIQYRAQPATLATLLARRTQKPLARLVFDEVTDCTHGSMASATLDFNTVFESARTLWRTEQQTIAQSLHHALPGLKKNIYKPALIERAFDAWRRYFDAQRTDRAPEIKAELLRASRLQQSLNKGGCAPEHPFFKLVDTLLDTYAHIERAHRSKWQQLVRDWLEWGQSALLEAKRMHRLLSYSDLLTHLQRALQDQPALTHALQARYRAALIDEFQDTDPLQFDILQRLFAPHGPLFLIGDPKQAIYSFRAADLQTYLAARRTAVGGATLAVNQRSNAALINACNRIFSRHRNAFILDGLHYTPVTIGTRARPPLIDSSPPCRVWMLPDGDALMTKRAAFQAAAHACAAEIVRLLEPFSVRFPKERARRQYEQYGEREATPGKPLKKALASARLGDAPLAPSDIAVLVQTRAQGSLVKQVLSQWGIDSVELAQTSIFETEDAEAFERILRALEAPYDIPCLRAALLTDWLGVDAHALADDGARYGQGQGAKRSDGGEPAASPEIRNGEATPYKPLKNALEHWVERFTHYRMLWQTRGFAMLWRTLLHELQIAPRLAAQPSGERRLTDLNHLAEQIQAYTAQAPSIAATLRWFMSQRAVKRIGPAPEALRLRLESDRALVRIATVHIAKGLEYAVVLCPFLNDGELRTSSSGGLHRVREYHDADGQAVFHYAPGEDDTKNPPQRGETVRIEQAAERARLIYVALTRAIYRCTFVAGPYISGSRDSIKQSRSSILNWLVTGAGREFLDWFAEPPQPEEISACWHALASDTLTVEPLPMVAAPSQPRLPAMSDTTTPPIWHARTARRRLQWDWQIASFTSLTAPPDPHAASVEASSIAVPFSGNLSTNCSERVSGKEDGAQEAEHIEICEHSEHRPTQHHARAVDLWIGSEDDILHFPRGIYAGRCLHRLFEYADLAIPQDWPAAIERTLHEYPELARHTPHLPAMMTTMLRDVAASELVPDLMLGAVESAHRLTELKFIFPVATLDMAALRALLKTYDYPEPALTMDTLSGYLRGVIDRVFQHDGRYWIVDWKSNHLGNTPACYAPTALRAAIAAHTYDLQTLLYTLAVHRYLRIRLPDYNYARHFGGALTLFVRGIRPAWRVGGECAGVHLDTPAPALIETLDQWMDGKKV